MRQPEEGFQNLERHLGQCLQGLIAVDDLAQLRLGQTIDAILVDVLDDMPDLDAIAGNEMQLVQDTGTCCDGPRKWLEQPSKFRIPEV